MLYNATVSTTKASQMDVTHPSRRRDPPHDAVDCVGRPDFECDPFTGESPDEEDSHPTMKTKDEVDFFWTL